MSEGVDYRTSFAKLQEQVQKLRHVLKDSERIALLLQDDPDPDGLASSLA